MNDNTGRPPHGLASRSKDKFVQGDVDWAVSIDHAHAGNSRRLVGLFDQELWVGHGEERYGPFDPVGGPVPLHRYRKRRKSRREAREDRVDALATKLGILRSVLTGEDDIVVIGRKAADGIAPVSARPIADPDSFAELTFATPLKARFAISEALRLPLGGLCEVSLTRCTHARCPGPRRWMQSADDSSPAIDEAADADRGDALLWIGTASG